MAVARAGAWPAPSPTSRSRSWLAASVGANLGVDFLPGALPFTPAAASAMDPDPAAQIVWLDALVMNVDRTPRNPNLLAWHGRVWLIDHGAAFYRQHGEAPLARLGRRAVSADPRPRAPRTGQVRLSKPTSASAEPPPRAVARRVALRSGSAGWATTRGGGEPTSRRFYDQRLERPAMFVEEAERCPSVA